MAKKKRRGRALAVLTIVTVLVAGAWFVYTRYFGAVHLKGKSYVFIYVKHGETLDEVSDDLVSNGVAHDRETFEWLAARMSLAGHLHPGKYRVTNGMTARKIVNMLRYNKQEKVRLTFNSQVKSIEDLAEYLDEKLELDAISVLDYFSDDDALKRDFGLPPGSAFAAVVPGTYDVSWAIEPRELMALLKQRFASVWTPARKSQARRAGLSVNEAITLASIVQSESAVKSEQQKIAGVYINRLKRDMPLQADPTLKFANGIHEVQRVLHADKEIDSPYNTYRNKGLPPGPICLVGKQAIDATLNFTRHNYIYFCARADLNGYSDFSATYDEHCRNARRYQSTLTRLGIQR